MTEYSNVIQGMFGTEPATQVTSNIDVDPDQTARAYQLERVTGVPASIIGGDLDRFETQSKAAIANHIVSGNSYIQDYVQSHPLASQISNDDYGNLDTISGHLKYLDGLHRILTPWMDHDQVEDPLKRFKETGELGSWIPEEDRKNYPLTSRLIGGLAAPIELTLKGAMGATMTLADEVKEVATNIGGESFGKEFGAMTEAELMGLTGRSHIPTEAIRNVATLHNAKTLEAVDAAVDAVQQSTTRERAPDLFHDNFVAKHIEGASINVSADSALGLYGDRIPDPSDGILGWVPDIQNQLDVARETGAPITVPMSQWIAKVDPEVHKALHDDLQVVPWGITAREAAEPPPIPKPTVDELVPQVRAATSMEPLFAVGDRKLELKRLASEGGAFGPEQGFHDFDMVNENGQSVGTINLSEQKGGKDLYVEMVNGIGEYYNPNNFGPALMRSLLRQLKAEFPNAEYLTGHRVSGAREAAGVEMTATMPRIKLAESDLDPQLFNDQMKQLVNGAWLETYPGIQAYVKPTELFTSREAEITSAVDAELDRLLPKGSVIKAPVLGIQREGQAPGQGPLGMFQPKMDAKPIIAYSLNFDSPIGIARHESIHALRRFQLFKPEEWRILEKAAVDEKWLDRYGINDRYADLKPEAKVEESVAEAFRYWKAEQPLREGTPKTIVDQIFQKLDDLLTTIKGHIDRILGKPATFDDLFSKIDSGEIAARGGKPSAAGGPMAAELPSILKPELRPAIKEEDGTIRIGKSGQMHMEIKANNPKDSGWVDPDGNFLNKEQASVYIEKYFGRGGEYLEDLAESGIPATLEEMEEILKNQTPDEIANDIYVSVGGTNHIGALKEFDKTFSTKDFETDPRLVQARKIIVDNIDRERSFKPKMAEAPLEPGTGTDVVPPFRAAKDVGMSIQNYKNYMKLIEARQKADLAITSRRAIAEQTKHQTTEWKAKAEAMRPDVARDLKARPDIAADKFLAESEFNGHKLENSYKLDPESLTPEQAASLPKDYLTGRNGVKPDDIAHLFGYPTGDQMIAHLAQLHATRVTTGLGRDRFMRSLIDMEIARRMEIENGYLQKNIMEEAMDQVLSQNQLDLLHEETHHLAELAGTSLGQITRDQLTAQIKTKFDALPMSVIDSSKWLKEAGKHGKNAETALLARNPADAFRSKQAQYYNAIYADMAKTVEKAKAKLDKSAKAFRKPNPKGIEPEYLNHIQDLLQTMGYKVGRSLENIQENLGRREKTLVQFADERLSSTYGLRDIPIADVIVDGKLRKVDALSTFEFMGAKQTIDALIKNGRDEQKLYLKGAAEDRAKVLEEMGTHVERFPLRPINATPSRWDKLKELPRQFLASVTNMETFLNRLGDRDPNSVFNKYVTYPAASAANRKSALQRQFAKVYRTIGEVKDKDKLVVAPINDPTTGKPFIRFTRANVATMLQNAGNKGNWDVLAKGYGADPAKLMDWLVANTRPADWTRAQKLGKEVFGELVKLADNEYEAIHGVTIDKIPLTPITNAHGTFEGWYHPLIKHPTIEGKSPIREGAYDDGDFGHVTTANGYTKKRSGAAYPLDLNPDMTPVRMNQMIHDIAFRQFILETQKLFKDPTLSNKITGHYGAEYNGRNFLMPWLRDIAGQESIPSQAARSGRNVSEMLRQNVISTYIGFNPFTAFKHGPTALVMSMKAPGVGPTNFLRAVQDLYARSPSLTKDNHEFVMKWSEELQRRERHWQDTLFGAHQEIEGSQSLRQTVIEKGSWLVAKSDMFSAKPTWLAAYRNAQEKGATHGDAIDLADAAVRDAHGSTAVTNQPALVRGGGALHNWLTSVYGFFGTVMQRRIELCQDIHDTWDLAKQGDITSAAKNVPEALRLRHVRQVLDGRRW